MKKTLLALSTGILVTPLALLLAALAALIVSVPSAANSGTNSIAIGNFSVSYPDGWSTLKSGSLTYILNVPANQQAALGNQFVFTPQVSVSIEQRLDAADALKQLEELAAGAGPSVVRLTVGGWPAVQWRRTGPWPQAHRGPEPAGSALAINTAIAAGSQLIRLYGSLPSDAPSAIADTIVWIETSVTFSSGSIGPAGKHVSVSPGWDRGLARTVIREARNLGHTLAAAFWLWPSPARADDEEDEQAPPVSEASPSASQPPAPGAAARIIQGFASEMEVVTSANGRNVVVAQQFVWTTSTDGGQTFPFFGRFNNPPTTNSTGGDSSLAVGASGNFYEGTIFNNTTAIHRSTDGGQTFTVRGTAFTCGAGQCNFTGASFPDQEHIAADRVNQVNNQDQVYNVFRNGGMNPTWGITCSTDGGATWSAGNVGLAGDFPRIVVGQDGFVYVAFEDPATNNLRIDRFAQCNTNPALPVLAGWPQTVAPGVAQPPCPVPGLDRCNNGNTLRSPIVAVDDTNAAHVFYAYAISTGAGNENILVRDSTDGGATWPGGPTTLNGGGTARRFMPWMCATKGTAYVTWYDRRKATTMTTNDLTDFFGRSASRSGANLNAGAEFQVNDAGTSDAQCLAGQAAGSQASWPSGSRAQNDSTSCSASEQPQLAGVCGTGPCGPAPGNACPAGQTCDLAGGVLGGGTRICRNGAQTFCDFNTVVCPTTMTGTDTCQLWGRGLPKYGDYNGNACAQGHLYAAWASATPARAMNPGIDVFFKVLDFVTPVAMCKNVSTVTDPGICTASNVSIDNGSNDPDFDTFTLSQSPPNPYNLGTTNVQLTITDQNSQSASCTANVTVNDVEPPTITCLSPTVECTSPAGAVVAKLIDTVSDNCMVQSKGCVPAEGSTFPLGVDPFTCTATDTSGNSASCSSTVTVTDTTPPVINSVVANPSVLWPPNPPNHKLVPVSITVVATDICDASPKCKVVSVTSNEPVLGRGSGHTDPDWIISVPGPKVSPATLGVQLRAERSGTGNGRVYTINLSCSDASGNTTAGNTTVTVPHDQGK